ncbi:GspE/PulE family protein [Vibrio parahaemolyticus]|uniref:GspE/PulE family protein n=13 Tax=Vibrio TaxID=662 RepID=A0A0L7U5J3_VIBPH|nr:MULTISPECIES: GspE/PulE family protein [Vibrio]EFO36913.1 msha biogenesis protein mshe [Vibrio parahaemolyticus Peru-466]EFO47121.1 msha biogenesis protein mshe [Vibrio parahaemolyticus AQ4037]EFO48761.1 msha biogenesis protein mshe [Vibrio parahaemolyticus K5030]EJG0767055.1 type II/IV secretion system protein [Vibrio parahaemolyticus O5:K30]EJG0875189.1 type II/IV secretion system protein [Vibrio parahaemolyticus O3]EJG0903817.1 type II/IV secretion system protein [Vibrio parahaemolyticu
MKIQLRKRLGDLLVEEGIVSEDQIQQALSAQRSTGQKLGDALIDLGFITEKQMLEFLSQQLGLPLIDLGRAPVDADAVQILPEVHARRLRAMVVARNGDTLRVAMSDPADLFTQESLMNLLGEYNLEFIIASERQLISSFDRYYRRTKEIASFAEQLQAEHQDVQSFDYGIDEADSEEVTVVKLVNSMFEDAVQVGASDIHIEPDDKVLRLRQRVDGVLHETILNEVNIASALVLRLKLMAHLDISEKRLPQDGRFNIKVRGQSIDIRMSTLPTQYGESVVMRLLNQSSGLRPLEESGLPPELLARLRRQLSRPHGMILVTGPTGSGKTTTLYGALSELNEPGKKIITAEDPVEYRLPRITQVQINSKIDLTFSRVLRTFLRQDPDIILIGEMRDQETVEIGLRAALTGHLVLSTLHTNDAVDSALRMIDMGAPGYLVASAVRAVVAQRLVRRVCPDCKTQDHLDESRQQWLAGRFPNQVGVTFHKGAGCQNCNLTGYRGRIGVFEMLELEHEMMDKLRANDAVGFAQAARRSENYKPLLASAMELALQGAVSLDEVMTLGEGDASGKTDPIFM